MAFKIDPAVELRRVLAARPVATIVGLTTGATVASPGMKVRLASALKAIASALERQAKQEVKPQLSKRKRHFDDGGVDFYLVPEEEKPALKTDVAEQLLPIGKYPQAWGTSKSGGNVKVTVGPLDS